MVPFLILLPVISDNYITTIYYYFLYFGQITLVVLLKATYGRGRPSIIGSEVTAYKCSCDYGMPSGHSSSAFMGYVIIVDFFDRVYFKIHTPEG
jgi:membrane-associated phospholipid phosphatase